jgi:hypothetical protein
VQPHLLSLVARLHIHEKRQLTKNCVHDRHPILKKGTIDTMSIIPK